MNFSISYTDNTTMIFQKITDYNTNLVGNLTKITLEEYFKAIHEQFYPNQDISFMEYFLELCMSNSAEFIVNHSKLGEYGVIKSGRSSDVKDCLNQFRMEKDIDYLLRNVPQQFKSGIKHKKEYILTPRAFKKCLMRAKDTQVYSDYYILLGEVFAYYTAYERGYKDKLLSMKDDKIDRLESKLDQQSADMKMQNQKIDQLLQFGNKLVGQNDTLQLSIDMTRE